LLAEKSRLLSKAQAFETMNLGEAAQSLWATVGACEELLAPLLELLGRESEAALHRISAASCYEHPGDPGHAANLYRAALAGPLTPAGRKDVQKKLTACLKQLRRQSTRSVA
jgi:hypothetical protein